MLKQTYLLLSLATIFWGIQPLCIKILVQNTFRYLLISTILFIIIYLKKEQKFIPPKHCIVPLILMGLTGIGINNVAQFTGLQYSSITNCTLIAATGPAITALIATIFIHERLNFIQWIGIFISFIGVIFLITKGSIDVLLNFNFNPGDTLFIRYCCNSLVGINRCY